MQMILSVEGRSRRVRRRRGTPYRRLSNSGWEVRSVVMFLPNVDNNNNNNNPICKAPECQKTSVALCRCPMSSCCCCRKSGGGGGNKIDTKLLYVFGESEQADDKTHFAGQVRAIARATQAAVMSMAEVIITVRLFRYFRLSAALYVRVKYDIVAEN